MGGQRRLMHKVVIIDDNIMLLESISAAIDWNAYGCEVVGVAENGTKGKVMIERKKPDIIIADINMPGLDGLEMIKMTRSRLPEAKIVIITGYEKFDYAQKALYLHVDDYLLKPVDNRQLQKTIKALACKIDKETDNKIKSQKMIDYNHQIEKKLKDSVLVTKKYILSQIVNLNGIDGNTLIARLKKEGLRFKCFLVMAIGFDKIDSADSITKNIYGYLTGNGAEEVLDILVDNRLILFVFFNKNIDYASAARKCGGAGKYAQQPPGAGGTFSYTLSARLYKDFSDLKTAYGEILGLNDTAQYYPDKGAGAAEPKGFADEEKNITAYYNLCCDMLEGSANADEAARIISDIAESISKTYSGDDFLIKTAIIKFSEKLLERFLKQGARYERFDTDAVAYKVKQIRGLSEAKDCLLSIYNGIKALSEESAPKYSLLIQKFFELIRGNDCNNISLYTLADKLAISPSYLSGLVKKETGQKFIDIVTGTKVENAKKLLKEPRYSIEDIGRIIGYQNYISFYKAFKKHEGISPKEYRGKIEY